MKISHKALAAAVILQNCMNSVQGKGISCQASPGNYIIHEESGDNLDHLGAISISSNIPVTIQRYTDDKFMFEQQPVGENEAKVLVTSNCQNADFIPQVTWDEQSIDVYVQGADAQSIDLPFIDSSSYHAEWSYEIPGCNSDVNDIEVLPARRRLNDGSAIPPKPAFQPTLQHAMEVLGVITSSNECTVNVEIMLDGYSHDVDVTAPSTRIIDSNFQKTDFAHNSQNNCVVDVKTDIVFTEARPKRPTPMPTYGAVPGRPFVDSLGNTLMAPSFTVPTLPREDKSWSTVANAQAVDSSSSSSSYDNSTLVNANQIRLGKEWTESALGEHASVASFSAFAIALMTNQAPSDLVEAALTAALDEVRHAKTSFAIASRLTGIEVAPGALPEAKLVFGQDLKALAMAVAKEGCVDETLSAIEAAAEVEVISRVLSDGADDNNKYFAIDRDILTWIRDELQIIASEESSHAALAWRTVQWVCSIDSDACDAVHNDILSEDKLEEAFHRRFSSFHGNNNILKEMKESWSKIRANVQVCTNPDTCL
ncbi:hypothetical protein ACHAXH_004678 [Discostella pseudostelligera]